MAHSFPRFDADAAGSFILRLALGLEQDGIQVRVIAPSAPGLDPASVISGIQVRRFRYAPRAHETLAYSGTMAEDVSRSVAGKLALASFILSEGLAIRAQISEWKPDLIHAHWWFPNGLAAVAPSRLANIPLITTSHGTDLRLLQTHSAARPLARFVFGRSARVTCVSHWLADQAALYSKSVPIVAPMPVDADRFAPGSDRDSNRAIFVGRLVPQKGIEHAIRALALMRRSVILDVVGDGPDRARLVELANHFGVGDRILWRGHVRHSEMPALLSRAAVLVAPFIDEGLGLVAAEAQLSETPPVGFASGGLTDVIESGVTGLLVPPGDTAALAAAVESIAANPDRREILGRAGRASALARFSPAAAAATYSRIYIEALHDSTRTNAQ